MSKPDNLTGTPPLLLIMDYCEQCGILHCCPGAPCFSPLDGMVIRLTWHQTYSKVPLPLRQSIGSEKWMLRVMGASNQARLDKECWWVALAWVSLLRSHYFSEHGESALFLKCNLGNKNDWMSKNTHVTEEHRYVLTILRQCGYDILSSRAYIIIIASPMSKADQVQVPHIACRSFPDRIWSGRVCFGSCNIEILTPSLAHDWHSEARNIIDMRKGLEGHEVLTNPVSGGPTCTP